MESEEGMGRGWNERGAEWEGGWNRKRAWEEAVAPERVGEARLLRRQDDGFPEGLDLQVQGGDRHV